MRLLSLILAAVAVLAATAQEEIADFQLNVQDFRELTVVDGVNVDYRAVPDSAGWAVFSCPPELASQLMFSNNREHLTIQTTASERAIPGMPRVTVYSTVLTKATNTGDSTLRLLTLTPVESIKIKEMGNGRVEAYGIESDHVEASVDTGCGSVFVQGTARKGKLRNVGTGTLDADGLALEQASIYIFGSGPVECNVSDKITVYGLGPGKVRPRAMPAKVSNRSIGVKVVALPPNTPYTETTVAEEETAEPATE